jgi:hypothetical protein
MSENSLENGLDFAFKLGLKSLIKFVAWISVAAGGIGLILTSCGFIISNAYLESLGIPRSVFEAQPREYILLGGNFIISLFLFTTIGLVNIIFYAWWIVLIITFLVVICIWRKYNSSRRIMLFSGLYGVWLIMSLSKFRQTNNDINFYGSNISPETLVQMITALFSLALVYLVFEIINIYNKQIKWSATLNIGLIFISLMVISSFTTLPYLKGAYATKPSYQILEPLGESKVVFNKILKEQDENIKTDLSSQKFELIQIGTKNVILRDAKDKSIIIIPSELIKSFKLKINP